MEAGTVRPRRRICLIGDATNDGRPYAKCRLVPSGGFHVCFVTPQTDRWRMMKSSNFKEFHIRKWYVQIEDTLANETGMLADGEPVRKGVIAAAISNRFAGQFVQDLQELIDASSDLGTEFGNRLVAAVGENQVLSYGKACIVVTSGEYEHGNALLTAVFADPIRALIGGAKSWIPSTGKRGAPGTAIDIPLAHKDELYVRSHYDTITAMFADAPNSDEVVVAFAFATRGRLHARLGGPQNPTQETR